jgi:hypothetical protein
MGRVDNRWRTLIYLIGFLRLQNSTVWPDKEKHNFVFLNIEKNFRLQNEIEKIWKL